MLTGVKDSSVDPALSKTDRDSGVGVLQQDFRAACPRCRGFAQGIVIAPVPNHHTVIILGVHLQEWEGQRSAEISDFSFLRIQLLISGVVPHRSC